MAAVYFFVASQVFAPFGSSARDLFDWSNANSGR